MAQIHSLQSLVRDALEVVEFKLIRCRDDVKDLNQKFSPDMAHQIFGEKESIFGYNDPKVSIMYTAGSMQIYLGMKYNSRVEEFNTEGIRADDVIGTIASKLPDGCYYTNLDKFLKEVDKSLEFKPFGEKLDEYKTTDTLENDRLFEIFHCDHTTPKFQNFFTRLQTFVLWFVDAASYIDVDDPQWTYFICYEKFKNSDGDYQYATVGYTTVYQYYAYPEHIRPRISQMLILPPFQKLGIGTKLIEAIYRFFARDPNVRDITVEDPSDEFQHLRNYIDTKLCRDLPAFARDVIKRGFSKEMVKEARDKWKINARQCRKVYEILRLLHTNIHDPEDYKQYRIEIKKRLNLIHYKQLNDIKKMQKAGVDTQWMTATLPSPEERLQQLNEEYKKVEQEYENVVKKLE